LSAVPIGPGPHPFRSVPDRHLHQLQCALDPRRPPAAGDQPGPGTHPVRLGRSLNPVQLAAPTRVPAAGFLRGLAMVIHYPPARLRYNSDQPTAITNVLITTAGSSSIGEIPLGAPTCSARTRRARCALSPNGDQVVVVWPGGALTGLPGEVAGELDRLGSDGHDDLDRGAVRAIRRFLTDPAAHDAAVWSSTRARTWSSPAVGYWLSGPPNQPRHDPQPPATRPG